jgi:hypothetical protein
VAYLNRERADSQLKCTLAKLVVNDTVQ